MRLKSIQSGFFIILLIVVTLVFFALVQSFLQPVFWAAVLAVIFYPVQNRWLRITRQRRSLASLLTTVAVTLVGSVGFVGLVVPHLVRFVIGNDQRLLLPAVMLAGGALLTLADTAARTVIAPQQLSVGVLTALIGVPVFLFLLARRSR